LAGHGQDSDAIEPLRAYQVGSSAVAQVAARVLQFASLALIVRLIVRTYGPDLWGTLAAVLTIGGLLQLLDFSLNELTVFLAATSTTKSELERGIGRAMTFALLPTLVGGLAFVGVIAGAPQLLSHHALGAGDLRWLLASMLANFVLALPVSVWSGTLQGLGWIKEYNFANSVEWTVELACVAWCISTQQDLVVLQWVRGLRLFARALALLVVLYRHEIPIARPRAVPSDERKKMFDFALGYSVSRGFGIALYRAPVLLASMVLPPIQVGAIAAADQVASAAYRVSHVFYEALFHRFARYLKPGAPESEVALGQQQYVGMTAIIAALVGVPGLGLVLLGGWIFEVWLGTALPMGALALPWLTWTWVLNAVGSPSSCVLLATGHARRSIVAHAAAIVVNVALALLLSTQQVAGIGAACLAANAVLVVGLSLQALRVARVSLSKTYAPLAAMGATFAICEVMFSESPLHPLLRGVAGATVAGIVALGILRSNPAVSALRTARAQPTM
jgi:O-antigen/teichoic acid export membrane protein